MNTKLFVVATLPFLFASTNLYACDDKPCESAYIASTHQYIENSERHADAVRSERLEYLSNFERQFIAALKERRAHARNRERRDFALYKHLHPALPAKAEQVDYKLTPKAIAKSNKPTMI